MLAAGQNHCAIVWFKRDLRVEDNAALAGAAANGPVLPLYIVEPGLWQQRDASARHWDFISESLVELRKSLARMGAPLIVRVGDAVQVLSDLHRDIGVSELWSHQETGNGWTYERDKRVRAWCRAQGIAWHEPRQNGVLRPLRDRNGWAKAWDRFMALPFGTVPALQSISIDPAQVGRLPSTGDLGLEFDRCDGRQTGGRDAAIGLLDSFLSERGIDYRREMSSPIGGETGCSRLSPHLAWGTISLREAAQATQSRMASVAGHPSSLETRRWRASLTSFWGRLHWHCHFMQKLESDPGIEFENLHKAYDLVERDLDPLRLAAWSQGQTGFPFLDACMRSLAATGWLNFRMRAMLMAFASYHLWLPWRETGLVLARLFTDYEPGIHWPQTQMQSGTTGINTVRIYNPVKQGYDQDPECRFVRRWIPELSAVPDAYVHEPWKWSQAATVVGKKYAERIVDHVAAAREARDRVWAVRSSSDFRAQAGAIQDKHGSRKSGLPNHGRRKKRNTGEKNQMGFNF
jgi:deoxyribodipyrimidine photo-lyase